jgi:hypothetical protein
MVGRHFGDTMKHYRDWPLMDSLPAGWAYSKAAGSPLSGYAFAQNGSPLRGAKLVLVRVRVPQMQLPLSEPESPAPDEVRQADAPAATREAFAYDASQARTVNELARQKFKHRLLADILVDLTICEIEGWCKREYINELRELLNGIGRDVVTPNK